MPKTLATVVVSPHGSGEADREELVALGGGVKVGVEGDPSAELGHAAGGGLGQPNGSCSSTMLAVCTRSGAAA